jgi:hypothetical protein
MELTGYALFSPVALALGILILGWGMFPNLRTQTKVFNATAALWLLSSLVVLGFIFIGRGAGYGIDWQRDIGYAVGGLIALLPPFALVAAVLRTGINITRRHHVILTLVMACAVAAVVLFFLPTLFFVSWLFGCILTGYPSCM